MIDAVTTNSVSVNAIPMDEDDEIDTIKEYIGKGATHNVKLSLLSDIVKIMGVASRRGLFEANEMSFAGRVHDEVRGMVVMALDKARSELNAKKLETIEEEAEEETGEAEVTEGVKVLDITEEDSETIPVSDSTGVQSS